MHCYALDEGLPRNYMPAAARSTGEITHGLTLRGAQLSWAILEGEKVIENRTVSLPAGWIAIHTGVGKLDPEHERKVRSLLPNVPPEALLPHGCIVGACRIDRATSVQACMGTDAQVWATGPVCNIVGAVCKLSRPVPHKGALGLWPIDAAVLGSVQAQLREATVREADPARLPPLGVAPPSPCKRKRAFDGDVGSSSACVQTKVQPLKPPKPPAPLPAPLLPAQPTALQPPPTEPAAAQPQPPGPRQPPPLSQPQPPERRQPPPLSQRPIPPLSGASVSVSAPPAYAPPLFRHHRRHESTR